jgi:hypothetical protein
MKILSISTPYISLPLCYIFNKAISVGTLPSRLKYSIVTPIYKKGDKPNCALYRPISLFNSYSKVFEKNTINEININTNGVLPNEQFGFRAKLSTEQLPVTL